MGAADVDVESQRELIAKRVEFIELLDEHGQLEPRDFVSELDCSRSTVTRALGDLRDAGLVAKAEGAYTATAVAIMLARELRRHEAATRAMLTAKPILDTIEAANAPDTAFLVDSDRELATEAAPFRPVERVADQLRDADGIRAYLPTLATPSLLHVLHQRVVHESVQTEVVFDADLFDEVRGQYATVLGEMAASDVVSIHTTTDRDYALVVTEHDDRSRSSLLSYEGGTKVSGSIHNDTAEAVTWARSTYDDIAEQGTDAEDALDDLRALVPAGSSTIRANSGATVDRPASGGTRVERELPLELRQAGFMEVDRTRRDGGGALDPMVSWQTEFSLAEVRAGHAVPRFTADGERAIDRVLAGLEDGEHRVVVGPPGSGKSVLCKTIACEWADADRGPVLYREWGNGSTFDDLGLLEAALRESPGHPLVVVEDAIRPSVNQVFETMQRVDDRHDVSFLLDARREEWDDPDALSIDPELDAYRREAVEPVEMATFDRNDCERFVDHYESLTDARVGLTGEDLQSVLVDEETGGQSGGVDVGGPLLASHLLTRHADVDEGILDSERTELQAEVSEVHRRLGRSDDALALDVAVLACTLTASGIPVTEEYLYALADDEEYDAVPEAIRAIQGDVVFSEGAHGRTTKYRTRHDRWAVAFLEQHLEATPTDEARNTFGRSVTRLLSLADDPIERARIERAIDGPTPHLHRIDADPTGWATEVTKRLFELGQTNATLAPLYGRTHDASLSLPEACRDRLQYEQASWRGWMHFTLGDFEAAASEFDNLSDIDDENGLDESDVDYLRLREKHGKARLAFHRRDIDEAVKQLQEAIDLANKLDRHRLEATLWNHLAGGHFSMEAYDEARRCSTQARSLAAEHGFDELEAAAISSLGLLDYKEGEVQRAKERLGTTVDKLGEGVDGHFHVNAHGNLATIHQQQDEVDAAMKHYRRAIELARQDGIVSLESNWLLDLGSLALYRGNYHEAHERATDAQSLAERIDSAWHHVNCHNRLGEIAIVQGDTARAKDHAKHALELVDPSLRPGATAETHRLHGRAALKDGELEAAHDAFEQALDYSRENRNPKPVAHAKQWLARTELERDALDQAEDLVAEALEQYRSWGFHSRVADCEQLLAAIALERGETDAARVHLEAARDAAPDDAVPHVWERIDEVAMDVPSESV
jgi:tetratricopeptide (TPR) repeat protein/predicted transcriptional regulator/energy-coupling factor transporter ATP-binding protein EcfA2